MKQNDSPLSTLEPGTVQREQLRARLLDIAGTALVAVLALWTAWSALGVVRGGADAWIYCGVASVLLMTVLLLRWTGPASRREARGTRRRNAPGVVPAEDTANVPIH
ncbi:hypothetical protein [Streptomyces chryseus]|uniref:hypothetical protein n=1 Tax=Streptomyces chryseus TaxID=68186 RepID=UPI0019AB379F|nr:hypothetical protein [Streptomyces chryseus]GGX18091.1 hypothetical protein GCM10010353_36560 [Streptomyces chryseus]